MEDYTIEMYKRFKYRKYIDHIEIAHFESKARKAVIPAEIEGLPVTSIGEYAFYHCIYLSEITIPDSVISIGWGAFSRCRIYTINIPNSVTSIGEYAFNGCRSLKSITIPESVASICEGAFAYCESLTSITIPDSVTSIGKSAFKSCKSLTSITIPDSVASIDKDTFKTCSKLKSIEILNPECEIYDWKFTIYSKTEIKGYDNSTAQAYAEKYGRKFVSLGEAPLQ